MSTSSTPAVSEAVEGTIVTEQLTRAEARELSDRLVRSATYLENNLPRAIQGKIWIVLDYGSPLEWWNAVGGKNLKLSAPIRKQLHNAMKADGASLREMAAATGSDKGTAAQDTDSRSTTVRNPDSKPKKKETNPPEQDTDKLPNKGKDGVLPQTTQTTSSRATPESTESVTPEMEQLKTENRRLKAELSTMRGELTDTRIRLDNQSADFEKKRKQFAENTEQLRKKLGESQPELVEANTTIQKLKKELERVNNNSQAQTPAGMKLVSEKSLENIHQEYDRLKDIAAEVPRLEEELTSAKEKISKLEQWKEERIKQNGFHPPKDLSSILHSSS